MPKNTINYRVKKLLAFYSILFWVTFTIAQQESTIVFSRDQLATAAKEIIASTSYCTLITVTTEGVPYARLMDPFPVEDTFEVFLGTNCSSRKVAQINSNPYITLFYEAPQGRGYVSLQGKAMITSEKELLNTYWKPNWEAFYSKDREEYCLIKVTPIRIEVVDYQSSIVSTSNTWEAPTINFTKN